LEVIKILQSCKNFRDN